MDTATNRLTWQVEVGCLGGREARVLLGSVAALQHWFGVWGSLVTAALARPLHLTLTGIEGDGTAVETTLGASGAAVLGVPRGLVRAGAEGLGAALVVAVLDAVEEAARRWPHEVPPQPWVPDEDAPGPDDPEDDGRWYVVTLDFLEPQELLLLGRSAGTGTDELSRFHTLDEHVAERTEGLAELDGTEGGCSSMSWILRLTDDGGR